MANDCIKSLIRWQVTCEQAYPGHDFAAEVAVASSDKCKKRALVKHPINARENKEKTLNTRSVHDSFTTGAAVGLENFDLPKA